MDRQVEDHLVALVEIARRTPPGGNEARAFQQQVLDEISAAPATSTPGDLVAGTSV